MYELLDEAAGDLRREQRLAAGDHAHRGEEFVGQGVLEEETAGAGAKRFEYVFVKVEGGQDQDSCRRRRIV